MKEKKLVYGVGINDADYNITEHVLIEGKPRVSWRCPYYIVWVSMLMRCYCESFIKKRPMYRYVSVCEEWHRFMTFKGWMEKQDWKDKVLDKDLLIVGNKTYGPFSCIFIDTKTNCFISEKSNKVSDLPTGVSYDKFSGKYKACGIDVISGKYRNLGRFEEPEKAHKIWLTHKLEQAKILASRQTDPRAAEALIDRYENYHIYFGD